MALGGGNFTTQNKGLPGAYINFVSAARADAQLSERGYVAMALELEWGPDGEVFTVEAAEVQKNAQKIFGYGYTHEKMKGIRDLFRNAKTLYAYRLNSGVKAENTYATAKYTGTRGNDIKIVIAANVDDTGSFDVKTLVDNVLVDSQTVRTATDLLSNDYVDFKSDGTLEATAGIGLTGGSNKTAITGTDYQGFLDKIESYSFNTLGCLATESAICELFTAFTRRLRDENGMKFQTVLYRTAADYEGVISVENAVSDSGWPASAAVYWTAGAEAGCAINKTNTNKLYDGEFSLNVGYSQIQLTEGVKAGQFMFHKVGDKVRVLEDLNTFVSFMEEKNSDFASNQTIRVLDQIGNDMAVLFNGKYLGNIPNDESGRISFWNDIVKHHQELQKLRAIEEFSASDVVVEKGQDRKAVFVTDRVMPTNAMTQLYMVTVIQ
ncbi:phage tail protein [Aminipila butyrica]|uniref:Phage tail protein n=1 Tax=Aminipila butyrica TaxID=433296 RepID=A0A858BU87_9FIRM|nr:phage tail sheath family protein [Aminipila butyrica]QIB68638.1 phage tail protein [Aminipila butyrica]